MKLRHWIVSTGLLLTALIFLAAGQGCADQHRDRVDFGESNEATVGEATIAIEERSESLKTAVESHQEPSATMVYLSWFPDSRTEMFLDIHPDGHGGKGILKDGKATFKQEAVSLTAAQVKEVEGLLTHLPPSVAKVPQGQAVLVSYYEGEEWQTKGYSRFSLPPQIVRIYELSQAEITTTRPAGSQ